MIFSSERVRRWKALSTTGIFDSLFGPRPSEPGGFASMIQVHHTGINDISIRSFLMIGLFPQSIWTERRGVFIKKNPLKSRLFSIYFGAKVEALSCKFFLLSSWAFIFFEGVRISSLHLFQLNNIHHSLLTPHRLSRLPNFTRLTTHGLYPTHGPSQLNNSPTQHPLTQLPHPCCG